MSTPSLSVNSCPWGTVAALHLGSVIAMAGVIASVPDPNGAVALVYSPFTAPAAAFTQAEATGARVLRVANVPWVVVVAPSPDDPDFPARARASGALLLVNPLVAGGCSASAPSPRSNRSAQS